MNPDTIYTIEYFEQKLDSSEIQEVLSILSHRNSHLKSFASPEVQNLLHVRESILNLTNYNRSTLHYNIDEVKSNNQVEIEKLKLIGKSRINQITEAEINWIKSYLIRNQISSSKDLFNHIGFIHLLSDYYFNTIQVEKSVTCLLKGLSILSIHDKGGIYYRQKDNLIAKFIIYITRENNCEEYSSTLNSMYNMLSSSFLGSFQGAMIKVYLKSYNLIPQLVDSQEDYLIKALNAANYPDDKFTALLNLGYYYEGQSDKEKYLTYYTQALDQVANKCSEEYFIGLLCILSSSISKDEAQEYIGEFFKYRNCNSYTKDKIEFLIPNYLNPSILSSNLDTIIGYYTNGRQLSNKLFPGLSTLHLQDYYASNYVKLCSTLDDTENISIQNIELLINTCLDTKEKEKNRQKLKSRINDRNKDIEINQLLLDINQFKKYFPNKTKTYDRLFNLYLSFNRKSEIHKSEQIDLNHLIRKLENNNAAILNIVKASGVYCIYYFDGSEFILSQISDNPIDSTAKKLYDKLINRAPLNDENYIEAIFDMDIPKSKNLIIIPDGIFAHLPPSVYLKNKNIQIYSDISKYLKSKTIEMPKDEIHIYSYSDSISISSKNKLKYTELPYSISETKSIKSILNLKDIQLTSSSFSNSKNTFFTRNSYIHLSTHAYSSSSNRLDNFFLLKKDKDPIKYYGFELYNAEKLPDVVVLSACQTGIGVHAYGAGVQTLSRAFLDNGAQTVIKTLWKVNEVATAEFMTQMYAYWSDGSILYDALNKTKEDFKQNPKYTHPYYWAGFVLEGNPNIRLDLN